MRPDNCYSSLIDFYPFFYRPQQNIISMDYPLMFKNNLEFFIPRSKFKYVFYKHSFYATESRIYIANSTLRSHFKNDDINQIKKNNPWVSMDFNIPHVIIMPINSTYANHIYTRILDAFDAKYPGQYPTTMDKEPVYKENLFHAYLNYCNNRVLHAHNTMNSLSSNLHRDPNDFFMVENVYIEFSHLCEDLQIMLDLPLNACFFPCDRVIAPLLQI